MEIKLNGLPINLLKSYYEVFERSRSLLQIFDQNVYIYFPITFSILHIENLNFIRRLSAIGSFEKVYLYNILDCTSELYMNNINISFNLNFDKNHSLNVSDYEKMFQAKTKRPWFFPYDRVLIPEIKELDFFVIDIEEISLSFVLIKNTSNYINKIKRELLYFFDNHVTINYINDLNVGNDLRNIILNNVNKLLDEGNTN